MKTACQLTNFINDPQMSTWSLYLIRCKNDTLYTGISIDVERRFKDHQSNSQKAAKYLRGKGPLQLVFHTKIGSRSEASIVEAKVKKLSRTDKNSLINGAINIHSFLD